MSKRPWYARINPVTGRTYAEDIMYPEKKSRYSSGSTGFYDDLDEFGEDQNEDFGFSRDFEDEDDMDTSDDLSSWDAMDSSDDDMDPYTSYSCDFDDEDDSDDEYTTSYDSGYGSNSGNSAEDDDTWRDEHYADYLDYGVDPEDYETEEEYLEVLDEVKNEWRSEYSCENGIAPEDYEEEEEFLEAVENVKAQQKSTPQKEDPMWRTKRMEEAIQYGLSIFGFRSEKEFEDAMAKRKAQNVKVPAVVTITAENQPKPIQHKKPAEKKKEKFPVQKYANEYYGFSFNQAIADNLTLPEGIDKEDLENLCSVYDLFRFLCRVDVQFAFDAWKWCYNTFWPHCKEERCLLTEIIDEWSIMNDDFIRLFVEEIERNQELRHEILTKDEEIGSPSVDIPFDLLEMGKGDLAAEIYKNYCSNPHVKEKNIFDTLDDLVLYCAESQKVRIVYLFVEKILPLTETLTASKLKWHRKEWAEKLDEWNFSLDAIEKEVRGEGNLKRRPDWMFDYWDEDCGFEYAKAIADRLELPDGISKKSLKEDWCAVSRLFDRFANKDKDFAIRAWKWCYETLFPYSNNRYFITDLLENWEYGEDDFTDVFVDELVVNPELRMSILAEDEEAKGAAEHLIYPLLRRGETDAAIEVYDAYCNNPHITADDILATIERLVEVAKYEENSLILKQLRDKILPLLDAIPHSKAAKNKRKWLEEIEDYFAEREDETTEETEAEERDYTELAERILQHAEQIFVSQIDADTDSTIYRFVGVVFNEGGPIYSYRTYDQTIEIGDMVMVETSKGNKVAEVVSVMDCKRIAAPYPVDKTKFILRKLDDL